MADVRDERPRRWHVVALLRIRLHALGRDAQGERGTGGHEAAEFAPADCGRPAPDAHGAPV